MRCTDLNGDGVIDYEEFLAVTVHQMRLDKDELMFKAFKQFDVDGSGFISEQELRDALSARGAEVRARSDNAPSREAGI
jgi:calcium-dependent protein kinase